MPSGSKKKPGPLSVALGDNLRAEMARKRITNKMLGEAIGKSPSQVSGVLNAKKHVDIEDLDRICYSLGLDMEDEIRKADQATPDRHAEPDWETPRLRPEGESL